MWKENAVVTFALKSLYLVGIVAAPVAVWFLKIEPNDYAEYPTLTADIARFVRAHGGYVVAFPAVAGLSKWWLERRESKWIKKIVHDLLTAYGDQIFGSMGGATHHHRVTLFVHKHFALKGTWPWRKGRMPWSGWLVPVVRSGHTTQKVKARFLAPDEADRSEGIAGMTWCNQSVVTAPTLPVLTAKSPATDIDLYGAGTGIGSDWIRDRLKRGETLPQSLRGLPVEVSQDKWGVVVLDSRMQNGFVADPTGSGKVTLMFLSTLGGLLERSRI